MRCRGSWREEPTWIVVLDSHPTREKPNVTLLSLRKTAPSRTAILPQLLSATAADPVLCLRQARNSTTELVGKTASLIIWQRITIGSPEGPPSTNPKCPRLSRSTPKLPQVPHRESPHDFPSRQKSQTQTTEHRTLERTLGAKGMLRTWASHGAI